MSIQMVLVSSPAKPVLRSLLHQGTCCFRLCKQVARYRCACWCTCISISRQAAHSRPGGRSRACTAPHSHHPSSPAPVLRRAAPGWHARPYPGLLISEGTRLHASFRQGARVSYATLHRPRADPLPRCRSLLPGAPERLGSEVTPVADRLRELAECLPPGASVTLTRDGLLELAAVAGGRVQETAPQADFTVGELALRFHRSPSTIRDWCEHGRLGGAYKLNGRDWRNPQGTVEAFPALYVREHQVATLSPRASTATRGGG